MNATMRNLRTMSQPRASPLVINAARTESIQERTDELEGLLGDVDRVLLERIELDRHPAGVLVRLERGEDGLVVHRALAGRQVEMDAVGRDVLEMEVGGLLPHALDERRGVLPDAVEMAHVEVEP